MVGRCTVTDMIVCKAFCMILFPKHKKVTATGEVEKMLEVKFSRFKRELTEHLLFLLLVILTRRLSQLVILRIVSVTSFFV